MAPVTRIVTIAWHAEVRRPGPRPMWCHGSKTVEPALRSLLLHGPVLGRRWHVSSRVAHGVTYQRPELKTSRQSHDHESLTRESGGESPECLSTKSRVQRTRRSPPAPHKLVTAKALPRRNARDGVLLPAAIGPYTPHARSGDIIDSPPDNHCHNTRLAAPCALLVPSLLASL